MTTLAALLLLAGSQAAPYEAKATTFGCFSIEAVAQLRSLRSDPEAFRKTLFEKQIYGQCVTIPKGTLVEGSIEPHDSSILRVNSRADPPGYEAPLEDFQLKADGKQ